ncbi:hypothetical protein [Noviherbaspirillum sp.]|uniref:hypothetical protein n=1 Tax=Noviherbaspirillum sp. TaxID=1926288 RepID=UPI002FE4012D
MVAVKGFQREGGAGNDPGEFSMRLRRAKVTLDGRQAAENRCICRHQHACNLPETLNKNVDLQKLILKMRFVATHKRRLAVIIDVHFLRAMFDPC